jgi:hypothetical protein
MIHVDKYLFLYPWNSIIDNGSNFISAMKDIDVDFPVVNSISFELLGVEDQ